MFSKLNGLLILLDKLEKEDLLEKLRLLNDENHIYITKIKEYEVKVKLNHQIFRIAFMRCKFGLKPMLSMSLPI